MTLVRLEAPVEGKEEGREGRVGDDKSTKPSTGSTVAAKEMYDNGGNDSDDRAVGFDADEAERIQNETVPKALRFNSPGRKANLSLFVEGKRKRKPPARHIAKS